MTFYQIGWFSSIFHLHQLISWSSKNANDILQSLNHVEINLKLWFLIKSGYYIVPSPSTALDLSKTQLCAVHSVDCSRCAILIQITYFLLRAFNQQCLACRLGIGRCSQLLTVLKFIYSKKTTKKDLWMKIKENIRTVKIWRNLLTFLTLLRDHSYTYYESTCRGSWKCAYVIYEWFLSNFKKKIEIS